MGEAPTKPGWGAAQERNALSVGDTQSMEPVLEPPPAAAREPRPAPIASAAGTQSLPTVARYRLGAELGRGGMGRVVEAFDVQLGRTVALKEVLPAGGDAIARRFAREVQLTARLEHPSIVPLYDAGTTPDGRPFYVMRRVTGQPLEQLLTRASELGDRLTLLPAVLAAIDAVAHAHRRGVIHRDLKPANILVGELGETVVIDWGLAKVIGEDDDQPGTAIAVPGDSLRTQLGAVFGTPGFMAPEQARGEPLGPRGDVYALGATLYQLLAGAPPHAGTSASEMIESAGRREVAPVATAAPGAPPELVAIVDKALAFDQAGRYPDAGALGEDVRRFLSGQLVAAHHYTPGQRVRRFARRHRGALSVAALAVVVLGALAGIGIRRIVEERDAASAARVLASAEKAAAERARDEVQRRADQLIAINARGLVESNPTHAAAVLKELPAGSARLGDARAVAQAAVMRGVAWTIPTGDELTVIAELSPDGKFLLQVTRDNRVRVWDLDRRQQVIARPYARAVRALWLGAAVLVTEPTQAPELVDPFAGPPDGQVRSLAIAPVSWAVASATGDRVAALDRGGAVQLIEPSTGAVVALWPGHRATAIAIGADGSWVAAADDRTVAIFDATPGGAGRELAHHPGPALRLFGSRSGDVGYATRDRIVLCKLGPAPVWTEIDLARLRPARPVDYLFVGNELHVYLTDGKVMAWNGARLYQRTQLSGLSFGLSEADRQLLVAPGIDGQLHIASRLITGALHLPLPLRNLRIAARPGAPRIVALGRNVIVGFELAQLPEELDQPIGAQVAFVDDGTLLVWRQEGGEARWYDLATRASVAFGYEPRGLASLIDLDPDDGRVMMRERANDTALVVLRKNSAERRELARGPAVWGRLLPRGAILYGRGDNRLFAAIGAEPAREIATLDGAADNAVGLGGSRFAAASDRGELVRGDLAGGSLERLQLPAGAAAAPFVAADRAGHALVALDHRLLRWDQGLVELAAFDQPIIRVAPCDDGALVELADHAVMRTALVPGRPVRTLLSASDQPSLWSGDGQLVVGMSVNGQVVAAETASAAIWDLPAYHAAFDLTAISPTTRRFIQRGFGQIALWTLPLAPTALRGWLDDRTNAATDDDHALIWTRPRS
jgi:hypothetical protein